MAADLKRMIPEKGICNVLFLGFRKDMPEIMAAVDVLALPSLTEGLPSVILEAFSCCIPVIATDVGGVPELVIHGENGWLVRPQRPDEMIWALLKALGDKKKLMKMGKAGFLRVKTHFHFQAQGQKLATIYHSAIHGRNDIADFNEF